MSIRDAVRTRVRNAVAPRPPARPSNGTAAGVRSRVSGPTTGDDELTDEAEVWLGRAREIAALAAGDSDEAERLRHLTDPVAEALQQADFGRLMVPRAFGGHQASLLTAMRVVETFAEVDGSLAWNVWVMTGHGRTADYLTEEAADQVFRSGSVLAGSLEPTGRLVPVEGGYRVTGRWPFASASYLADWLIAAGKVESPRRGGGEEVLAVVMPRASCTIMETWHTTGLRATGSEDYVAEDVFVPHAFAFPASSVFEVTPPRPSLGYGRPYSEYSSVLMSAVAVGITRRAIDGYRDLVAAKRAQPGHRDPSFDAIHDEHLGRAEAIYQSSRAWLYDVGRDLDALRPGDPSHTTRSRLTGAHVAASCEAAVDLLYDIAGRAGIYTNASPLDRCFRDVHMISHHGAISFGAFVAAGRDLVDSRQSERSSAPS